jgi:SMODS and SLOG-associating 2TM effector domain
MPRLPNPKDLFIQQALIRCDELVQTAQQSARDNSKLADMWGKIHICLGVITALSSTMSALFTFSSNTIIVTILAIISAASATCLTSLNPSGREAWRRSATNHSRYLCDRAKNLRMKIPLMQSEDSIYKELEDIARQLNYMTNELLQSFERR